MSFGASETCWYCEWDPECQQELSLHPGCSPSTCRIGDISQVFKPKVATIAARLRSTKGGKAVDMLQPVVKSCKGITVEVKCYAHPGKTCKLRPSELHVGGSPCTDLSTLGDGAGLEGTTCVDTLAWLGSILVLEHTMFVSENVFSDDLLKLIQDTVGHLYVLEFVRENANPLKLGWPVFRNRQYLVGRHKLKTMPPSTSLSARMLKFQRQCAMNWTVFLIADEHEQWQEKNWAHSRGAVKTRLAARDVSNTPLHCLDFDDVLTLTEVDILAAYNSTCPPTTCWALGQDCRNERGRISGEQVLNTVVRNFGIVWIPQEKRWFCPTECLTAQGFTIDRSRPTNSFCTDRVSRKRQELFHQSGNSMHVESIGGVIAHCIADIGVAASFSHKTDYDMFADISQHLVAKRCASR